MSGGRPPRDQGFLDRLAKRIAAARRRAGLTQAELAAELGVEKTGPAQWETARNAPRPDLLPRLADALDCSTDYLLGRSPFAGGGGRRVLRKAP